MYVYIHYLHFRKPLLVSIETLTSFYPFRCVLSKNTRYKIKSLNHLKFTHDITVK